MLQKSKHLSLSPPESKNQQRVFHLLLPSDEYNPCADPESFVRGAPTLTFFVNEGGDDPNTSKSGSSSARQNGPTFMARLWPNIECWLGFQWIRTRIAKKSKGAKIRNRYNQVTHLTQDTNGKVTDTQQTPQTRAKMPALSQQATTNTHKQTRTKTQQTQDRTKTQKIHKRSTALERSVKYFTGGPKPVQRRQPHP